MSSAPEAQCQPRASQTVGSLRMCLGLGRRTGAGKVSRGREMEAARGADMPEYEQKSSYSSGFPRSAGDPELPGETQGSLEVCFSYSV